MSKGAVDRIGKRLRDSEVPDPADVAAYIEWSATFEEPLREALAIGDAASQRAGVSLDQKTSRIKQLYSIVAKLRRGHKRLSSMEDIAGCRVVVEREADVNALVVQLATAQVKRVRDYRQHHRNGYRAVHMTLVNELGQAVELQLRTEIQHVWAGLSERRAAIAGHEVKYGGGPVRERELLLKLSAMGRRLDLRQTVLDVKMQATKSGGMAHVNEPVESDLELEAERLKVATKDFIDICDGYASVVGSL